MAINDGSSSAAPAQAAPAQATTQFAQAPQAAQMTPQTFSFHTNSGLFSTPIGRNPGTEILVSLSEKLGEIFKAAKDSNFGFTLIPLDKNNETQLYYSSLIVVGSMRGDTKMASYHTLILEGSNEAPSSIHNQINNDMVEIVRTSADASDEDLNKAVIMKLRSQFPNVQFFNASSEVVPRDFDLEDKAAVHRLALNVAMATSSEIAKRQPGYTDLNMQLFARDSALVVTPRFEAGTVKNVDGMPRRQDMKILFGSQQNKQQQNQSLNSGDRATALAEISGYVDLLWSPPPAAQQGYMGGYGMPNFQQPTQKYAANFIITNFASAKFSTMSGLLLALTTVKAISDQNNWFGAFRSNGLRSNMRDVGYLNIEANLGGTDPNAPGTPIDTSMDTFSAVDLYRYLGQLVCPGLAISIDVPVAGPESWLMEALSVAASDSQDSRAAQEMIYQSAMVLTNGEFGKFFQNGSQMFENVGNAVELGYYEAGKDDLRDIRDIDYVAVAALTRDQDAIKRWSDTWVASSIPLPKRMDTRRRIIRDLLGGKAVITGTANRVTISAAFIDALVKGCGAAGVAPRLDSNALGNMVVDRGAASFINQALVGPQGGAFFSSNAPGNNYSNGFMPNSFRSF